MTYEILSEHSYDTTDDALYCLELGLSVFPINGYGIIWASENSEADIALGAPPVVYEWCCSCGDLDCESPGKHPLGPAWQRQATRDPDAVRRMDWRNHNIGVLTEGITVVDIDPRHGGTREWVDKHGEASTLVVRTNQGWHYYYKGETRTRIGLAPGIDIKSGVGGYVVGPGSHGEYREYVFEASKASGGFTEVPDWLRAELMRKKTDAKTDLVRQTTFGEGARNEGLTAVAGLLRRYGWNESELLGTLEILNRQRCTPPISVDEVKQIAESVAKYAVEAEITPSDIHNKVMNISDILGIPPPKFEIEHIWPEGGVNVLWGAPGTMKSYLALELLIHRAAKRDWHSFKVNRQVKTLYVAAEGYFGIGARVKSIMVNHGITQSQLAEHFFLYPEAVNILNEDKASQMFMYLVEHGYQVVVFDTLRKSMTGGDENNTLDIGRLMSMLEMWSLNGVSSLLIHHANKTGGHRGSSAIEGDAYNMLGMSKPDRLASPLETVLSPTKFKDAPSDFQVNITWIEQNGALVSESAVLEDNDTQVAAKLTKKAEDAREKAEMVERDIEIRRLRSEGVSRKQVADMYGLSQARISQIVHDK